MNPPDVLVTIEGVENELFWTDEHGDRCVRYFAEHDQPAIP